MQNYRELFLKVDAANTAAFIAAVDAALPDGWRHDVNEDEDSRRSFGTNLFHYVCDARGPREAARLVIARRDPQTLYVSTVIPRQSGQLEYEQYNVILADFHDSVLSCVNAPFPLTFILASDELHIEDLMPAEVFTRLQSFSSLANKMTGCGHPNDRERWFAFLVALNRSEHRLDGEALRRWLVEVENWPEHSARELVHKFEFARDLLRYAKVCEP